MGSGSVRPASRATLPRAPPQAQRRFPSKRRPPKGALYVPRAGVAAVLPAADSPVRSETRGPDRNEEPLKIRQADHASWVGDAYAREAVEGRRPATRCRRCLLPRRARPPSRAFGRKPGGNDSARGSRERLRSRSRRAHRACGWVHTLQREEIPKRHMSRIGQTKPTRRCDEQGTTCRGFGRAVLPLPLETVPSCSKSLRPRDAAPSKYDPPPLPRCDAAGAV